MLHPTFRSKVVTALLSLREGEAWDQVVQSHTLAIEGLEVRLCRAELWQDALLLGRL